MDDWVLRQPRVGKLPVCGLNDRWPISRKDEWMTKIEQSIDVEVPVRKAYNQWTQFEDFHQFMEGVERVDQIDDENLHWVTSIAGVTREFDAKVTEQKPDSRIAWRSVDGPRQAGVVTFLPVNSSATRVNVQVTYEPHGITEEVADELGIIESRVKGDLERFKEFIETRSSETGAWRGSV